MEDTVVVAAESASAVAVVVEEKKDVTDVEAGSSSSSSSTTTTTATATNNKGSKKVPHQGNGKLDSDDEDEDDIYDDDASDDKDQDDETLAELESLGVGSYVPEEESLGDGPVARLLRLARQSVLKIELAQKNASSSSLALNLNSSASPVSSSSVISPSTSVSTSTAAQEDQAPDNAAIKPLEAAAPSVVTPSLSVPGASVDRSPRSPREEGNRSPKAASTSTPTTPRGKKRKEGKSKKEKEPASPRKPSATSKSKSSKHKKKTKAPESTTSVEGGAVPQEKDQKEKKERELESKEKGVKKTKRSKKAKSKKSATGNHDKTSKKPKKVTKEENENIVVVASITSEAKIVEEPHASSPRKEESSAPPSQEPIQEAQPKEVSTESKSTSDDATPAPVIIDSESSVPSEIPQSEPGASESKLDSESTEPKGDLSTPPTDQSTTQSTSVPSPTLSEDHVVVLLSESSTSTVISTVEVQQDKAVEVESPVQSEPTPVSSEEPRSHSENDASKGTAEEAPASSPQKEESIAPSTQEPEAQPKDLPSTDEKAGQESPLPLSRDESTVDTNQVVENEVKAKEQDKEDSKSNDGKESEKSREEPASASKEDTEDKGKEKEAENGEDGPDTDEEHALAVRREAEASLITVPPRTAPETAEEATRDEYGFLVRTEDEAAWKREKTAEYKAALRARRTAFWNKYLLKHPTITKRSSLKSPIRGGIPSQHRGMMWQALTGSKQLLEANPGVYQALLDSKKDETSAATSQINLDLKRTFPDNEFFQTEEGLERLRRVLVAYSWRNPEVGYCQAMNFVCGLLLLFMTEEEAFWMLAVIVEKYLADYYTPTMESSHVDQRVLRALVAKKLPELSQFLAKVNVELSLFTRQWFLCLFIDVLPIETTLRVWDAFFNEGSKVLFRVALALLKINQKKIIESATTDDMLVYIAIKEAGVGCHDADALLKVAFHRIGSMSQKKIDKLKAFHRTTVTQDRKRAETARASPRVDPDVPNSISTSSVALNASSTPAPPASASSSSTLATAAPQPNISPRDSPDADNKSESAQPEPSPPPATNTSSPSSNEEEPQPPSTETPTPTTTTTPAPENPSTPAAAEEEASTASATSSSTEE